MKIGNEEEEIGEGMEPNLDDSAEVGKQHGIRSRGRGRGGSASSRRCG